MAAARRSAIFISVWEFLPQARASAAPARPEFACLPICSAFPRLPRQARPPEAAKLRRDIRALPDAY